MPLGVIHHAGLEDQCPRYRKEILASLLLVGITLFAYVGVLSCDFVSLDDDIYVTGNKPVLAGLSPAGVVYAWTTSDGSRP